MSDDLRTQLNRYLFLELGVDGDESRVSGRWPFELRKLAETRNLTVFEFHDDRAYYALVGESLSVLPRAGMAIDDLMLQISGARWIGERDPVDLSVVRLDDPAVPSSRERRERLEALVAATAPGEAAELLEGVLLSRERRYLALFRRPGEEDAFLAGLPGTPPIPVPFPEATPWRRLAWGVGRWLSRQDA